MVALFRIAPLDSGSIFIDGIDISTVPLSILRSKIGIIPQDPVIFSATIRYNLDPFSQHSDDELWAVLEMVKMKESIER
jgi:ABC-type multidrug transport system fused ATPase/permease subunit